MPDPDFPPVIQAMLQPGAYDHPAEDIQLLQTHISYVLLAGEYVYKIKKPVDFGFLNYSTLARRRHYCGREVTLNRRLCDDVYLGVVPIREDGGAIRVNTKRGRIVEYAVWMKRLPEGRMMHNLLERDQVTTEMVQAVAKKLMPFHQSAETSPAIAKYGDWAIRYNCAENVEQWQPYVGRTITAEQDAILRAYLDAFYARRADVLARRVRDLKIRQCHSDLRSDAVCFTCDSSDPDCICILDCVEFNRRIMLVDGARDVSFLSMDLEYRGRRDLADAFVQHYESLAKDPDLAEVLPYYACYNACVRGKVEGFLLDIPEVPEADKKAAAERARRYFGLAVEYARSLPPAFLVMTVGLSGTGKSTVAAELGERLGAQVLSSDVTRKKLAGLAPSDPALAGYREGLYSREMSERTFASLFEQARGLLMEGRSVILDATFIMRKDRKAPRQLAKECGAQFACVEVTANAKVVKERMSTRDAKGHVSDARWDIYVAQRRRYREPREIDRNRRFKIDTTRPNPKDADRMVAGLRNLSPLSVPD